MDHLGKIYQLVNKNNGALLYVGKTIRTLEQRIQCHMCKPNGLMVNYIFANGKDSFDIELIEDNIADSELDDRESYWIGFLDPPFNKAKTYKNRKFTRRPNGYIRDSD